MRTWAILVGWMMAGLPAFAACGAQPALLIDRGLHRQWRIERDCAHPARPAFLVEIPWSDSAAANGSAWTPASAGTREPVLIRPGMHVTVTGPGAQPEIHLTAVALEAGTMGATILVRGGLDGATLRAMVRGSALVELVPVK